MENETKKPQNLDTEWILIIKNVLDKIKPLFRRIITYLGDHGALQLSFLFTVFASLSVLLFGISFWKTVGLSTFLLVSAHEIERPGVFWGWWCEMWKGISDSLG